MSWTNANDDDDRDDAGCRGSWCCCCDSCDLFFIPVKYDASWCRNVAANMQCDFRTLVLGVFNYTRLRNILLFICETYRIIEINACSQQCILKTCFVRSKATPNRIKFKRYKVKSYWLHANKRDWIMKAEKGRCTNSTSMIDRSSQRQRRANGFEHKKWAIDALSMNLPMARNTSSYFFPFSRFLFRFPCCSLLCSFGCFGTSLLFLFCSHALAVFCSPFSILLALASVHISFLSGAHRMPAFLHTIFAACLTICSACNSLLALSFVAMRWYHTYICLE